MNILLSNDDGILANGIRALIEALSPKYNVYVVAPDRERSAAGHSLTLHTPLRVEEVEPKYGAKRCWMTTGTPGDCVKIAVNAKIIVKIISIIPRNGLGTWSKTPVKCDIINGTDMYKETIKNIFNVLKPNLLII